MQQLLPIWTKYFNLQMFPKKPDKILPKAVNSSILSVYVLPVGPVVWLSQIGLTSFSPIICPPFARPDWWVGAFLFIGVMHQEKKENLEAEEIQEVGDC